MNPGLFGLVTVGRENEMHPLPRNLVDRFAESFAGNRVGFSAKEITNYFTRYSNLVKPYDHYGMNPTRKQLFIESAYSLNPKQQYYALNDLTWDEKPSRYDYPNNESRIELRQQLHTFISPDPVGIRFSQIRETAFREDWATCITRLQHDPASAITAARTLLETLLKTIVTERGSVPDGSGDLGRLMKQAQDAVGFDRGQEQPTHQIISGLVSVVNGLATISNKAGDRHGLVAGQSIDDPGLAQLAVHAAGTVGVAFIELHLLGAA
ncbi:abortive infection family protein [Ectothiorhodospiraceae bacterium 2226]|nr:abortive infection family protein [Ectothiorhodospiraceae bacterium 2226]